MDGRVGGIHGKCALYVLGEEGEGERAYLTDVFDADPVLFLTSDFFVNAINRKLGGRFRFLSQPQTTLQNKVMGDDHLKPPHKGEQAVDVSPLGGRLVVFDSVVLPHEVMEAKRERYAASGWWHVKQQEEGRG